MKIKSAQFTGSSSSSLSFGEWRYSDCMPNGCKWPKITIVTPSFNQVEFIEETICSVLSQCYPNLEYIIMDGGSTDGSIEIIQKYEESLSFWVSEKDDGQYDAIYKGLTRGTGEIMAWINSDDIYCPWTLRTVAEVFSECSEVNWLSTMYPGQLDSIGHCTGFDKIKGFSKEAFLDGAYLPSVYQSFNFIQQESTFWRRTLWEDANGLDTTFRMAGDFDLWAKFFRLTNLYGLESPLACFRVQENQKSLQLEKYFSEAKASLSRFRKDERWTPNMRRKLLLYFRHFMKIKKIREFAVNNIYYQAEVICRDKPRSNKSTWIVKKHPFFFE